MRDVVTSEFVGHQPAWFMALTFEQATKEANRRVFVASALDENINRITVLVHSSSRIVTLSLNGDTYFIKVLGIPQATLSFLELVCIDRTKLLTPLANGFVGDGDVSFRQEFFDFTEAQTESMVEPDGVTDNFRGKTMTLIAGIMGFHTAPSLPQPS